MKRSEALELAVRGIEHMMRDNLEKSEDDLCEDAIRVINGMLEEEYSREEDEEETE